MEEKNKRIMKDISSRSDRSFIGGQKRGDRRDVPLSEKEKERRGRGSSLETRVSYQRGGNCPLFTLKGEKSHVADGGT